MLDIGVQVSYKAQPRYTENGQGKNRRGTCTFGAKFPHLASNSLTIHIITCVLLMPVLHADMLDHAWKKPVLVMQTIAMSTSWSLTVMMIGSCSGIKLTLNQQDLKLGLKCFASLLSAWKGSLTHAESAAAVQLQVEEFLAHPMVHLSAVVLEELISVAVLGVASHPHYRFLPKLGPFHQTFLAANARQAGTPATRRGLQLDLPRMHSVPIQGQLLPLAGSAGDYRRLAATKFPLACGSRHP